MIPMNEFPSCFPNNFVTEILPKEAKKENKFVYRIIKSGTINRESFFSTYEEIKKGLIPPKKRMDFNDPGIYSTSCNIDYSEAEYMLKLFMRHYPRPLIAEGVTENTCGPCQLTSERKQDNTTHVDWWIYEKAQPQEHFKEVNKNEK